MSTLKSSAEHLTLNADGSGNDIKFQSNATEVAAIDQSGNLTLSGTVDGVDIAARDAILTSTTTTAGAALPKAGGTMTGALFIASPNQATGGNALQIRQGNNTAYGIDMGLSQTDGHLNISKVNNGTSTHMMTLARDTGRVGIGTASPLSKLDVSGGFVTVSKDANTAGRIGASEYITGSTDNDLIVQATGSGVTKFYQSGVNSLNINATGNVGIGVVPEGHHNTHSALQVGGNGVWTSYKPQGASGEMDFQHNVYYSQTHGGDRYISTDEATKYRQVSGAHQWYTAGSGSAGSAPSWRYGMQINNDGIVTKPLQPSFRVGRNAGNVNGGTYVVHNVVVHNVGSHYSTSNGRFTAPVAGSYQFNVRLINTSGAYNTDLAALRINGSAANAANMHDVASVSHAGNSLSTTFYLSAGDYVQVYSQSHTVYGTAEQHCQFSGHLIG